MNGFNAFGNFIESSFVSILLTIDSVIYKGISMLYGLYLQLANVRYFTDENVTDLTNRIYLIIGVIALFLVTYTLLQAIINPDDSNKSDGPGMMKRIVIALVGVTLVPLLFNFIYNFQSAILSGNVITNFFMGDETYTEHQVYLEVEEIKENEDGTESTVSYYVCDVCEENDYNDCPIYYSNEYTVTSAEQECKATYGEEYSLIKEVENRDVSVETQEIIGNEMAMMLLSGFLYPTPGIDTESIVVKDPDKYFLNNILDTTATASCVVGIIGGTASALAVTVGGASTGVGLPAAILTAKTILAYSATGCITLGLLGAGVETAVHSFGPDLYTWNSTMTEINNTGNFEYIVGFADNIATGEVQYIPFLSGLAGLFLLYMIFSFCLDLGIRAVKLVFLQLIAPVPMFLSILPKNKDLISNWVKITLTTFAEVFVRIACISLVAYCVNFLNLDALDGLPPIGKAIILMGIVAFARQLPKFFGEVTGIKGAGLKLGIKEKLAEGGAFTAASAVGSMATVGTKNAVSGIKNLKKDWNDLSTKDRLKRGAGILGSTFAGASSGLLRGGYAARSAKSYGDVVSSSNKGTKDALDAKSIRANRKATYKSRGLNGISGHISGRLGDYGGIAGEWAGIGGSVEALDSRIKANQEIMDVSEIVISSSGKIAKSIAVTNSSYLAEKLAGRAAELSDDQKGKIAAINARTDISDTEKEALIKKAEGFHGKWKAAGFKHNDIYGSVQNYDNLIESLSKTGFKEGMKTWDGKNIENQQQFNKYTETLTEQRRLIAKQLDDDIKEAGVQGLDAVKEYLGKEFDKLSGPERGAIRDMKDALTKMQDKYNSKTAHFEEVLGKDFKKPETWDDMDKIINGMRDDNKTSELEKVKIQDKKRQRNDKAQK